MRSPSLAPAYDETVHLVLCDFGRQGLAYIETEPACSERSVVKNLLLGQYHHPVQVVACNVSEGWSRDVSEDIAGLVVERARSEGKLLAKGAQRFVEDQLGEELEPELCA